MPESRMKSLFAFLIILGFAIFFVVALNIRGIVPQPENYAAATATVMRAQVEATRYTIETSATATVAAAYVEAQQTAVPTRVETDVREAQTRAWGLAGGIAVALLFGLAVVTWMQTRAKIIPRDKTGQLPAILDGRTVAVPSRSLGAGFTMAHNRGWFWQILHRGQSPDMPMQVSDGNADADHYLDVAQADQQTAGIAALMRPGNTRPDRSGRLELIKKEGTSDVWGRQLTAPQTRVIANGNDAIEIIAKMLGDKLPKELSQPDTPPALPESAFLNLEPSPATIAREEETP